MRLIADDEEGRFGAPACSTHALGESRTHRTDRSPMPEKLTPSAGGIICLPTLSFPQMPGMCYLCLRNELSPMCPVRTI